MAEECKDRCPFKESTVFLAVSMVVVDADHQNLPEWGPWQKWPFSLCAVKHGGTRPVGGEKR